MRNEIEVRFKIQELYEKLDMELCKYAITNDAEHLANATKLSAKIRALTWVLGAFEI